MKNLAKCAFLKKSLIIGLVFFLPIIGGCQKNELENDTVPLSQIPDNPAYATLPLIGTQWKLIGFADEKTRRIKLAEPYSERSYTVVFEENGDLRGFTSTNGAWGQFSLAATKRGQINISYFGPLTSVNELYDGPAFIENMNAVTSFGITSKGLLLNYSKNNYLLLKPVE